MPPISDPRIFPLDPGPPPERVHAWHALVADSVSAPGVRQRAEREGELERSIAAAFADGDAGIIGEALAASRSAADYRQLWRAVIGAWRSAATAEGASASPAGVVALGFAMPVVVVAAAERDVELPMTISNPQPIVDAMREHGALAGNRNFGVGSVLAGERYVGLEATVRWPSPAAIADVGAWIDAAIASPVAVVAGRESAHLRWLLGSAIASPATALFTERNSGKWGLKAAEILSPQLRRGVGQVLALAGAPSDILTAWQQGLVAHREVALQLYASSALRTLRAAYGEPGAVISAHRTDPGELRISLSSPFGERDAEGFRCPLFPFERIEDVLKAIVELLEACRVGDVTVLPGLHPDRDAMTGLPLFFRADALPAQNSVQL